MTQKCDKITIPTTQLFSLNKMINASRFNKFAANNMKKKAERLSCEYLEEAGGKVDFYIDSQVRLKFTWHLSSKMTDPDNVSSAGRKIILDAMQKTPVNGHAVMIPGDSFKYLKGFQDDFCFDNKDEVDIEIVE